MTRFSTLMLAIGLTTESWFALADSTDAACEIYPIGEDHTDVLIPCSFSQRQGYVTIVRSDGVTHDLSPEGDAPGVYKDQPSRDIAPFLWSEILGPDKTAISSRRLEKTCSVYDSMS